MTDIVTRVDLTAIPLYRRGKVRDIFDLGDRLLIVATDRLSAFDVVLPTPLPGKGRVLTGLSHRWFDWSRTLVPNHLLPTDLDSLPISEHERAVLAGRSSLVRKARRIDVECVVRGFLAGSAWQEYRRTGTIGAEEAPTGLRKADRLPLPVFTPALKRDDGHDVNISRAELRSLLGVTMAEALESTSLRLYQAAADAALQADLLVADTKFEFGMVDDDLILIDELLTPDSSRYWDAARYVPGTEPPAYDKQIVRDWLEASGWDKRPPGPDLPWPIVEETMARYRDVEERITKITGGIPHVTV